MGRFMRRGQAKFYFVTALADPAAPTVAELTGANSTDITPDIAEVSGFTFSSDPIDVPDMDTTFTAKIPGGDTVENSTLTMYEDDADTTIYDELVKGATGFVVIFSKGIAGAAPAVSDVCDIWPAEVGSNAKQYTAANEASKYLVAFTPTAVPTADYALAA